MVFQSGDNKFGTTSYIVGTTLGDGCNFTSIQSAINAASAAGGGTVFIRNGNYAESFNLPSTVGLYSYDGVPNIGGGGPSGVVIAGTCSITDAGPHIISNICFQQSGAVPAFSFTGAANAIVLLNFLVLASGFAAPLIQSTNPNITIIGNNLLFVSTGADFIDITDGTLTLIASTGPSLGGPSPNIIAAGAASLQLDYSELDANCVASDTSRIALNYSSIQSTAPVILNNTATLSSVHSLILGNGATPVIQLNNSSTAQFYSSEVLANNAANPSAINITALASVYADYLNVGSDSATFAVEGTGNFTYGTVTFRDTNSTIDPGLSGTAQVVRPFSTANVSDVTAQRGLCSFNSSNFTVNSNGFVSLNGLIQNYTNVDHAASPYTVLSTDYYISVDTSAGSVTLNFPNAPTAKQIWIVKDRNGTAATNNIIITTPGGLVTFDGSNTYTIAVNYQSINILANATPTYEVF